MSYTATYKPGFFKDVLKLPREARERLALAVEHIRKDPFAVPARKLFGQAHLYRYRMGDYRIVYYIDNPARKIIFLVAAHRKDVYRRLDKRG
ncbi:MAG: type II toxin-antitoxin system RelE/ParE family toxin [Pseudomonadota bacterium]